MKPAETDRRFIDYDIGRVVNAPRRTAVEPAARPRHEGAPGYRVGDIMLRPAPTIRAEAPIGEAARRIVHNGEPELVVTVGGRPTGVVTARQLLVLVDAGVRTWQPRTVGDLVPPRTPLLLAELDVAAAARILTEDALDALPVVDGDGRLLGVLSRRQLVRYLASRRHVH